MSERFTKEGFSEHLNTKFIVPLNESDAIELELIEVVSTISTPRQEQFSIFFRGPADRFLQQGTYHMEHERMGDAAIFIVPVAKEADGFHYEAIFNYAL